MRALRTFSYIVLGIVVVGLLAIAGTWTAMGRPDAGEVAPNVALAGRPIGGMTRQQLAAAVDDLAAQYASTSIEVNTGDQYFVTPTSTFALTVDTSKTATNALRVGRDGFVLVRMYEWVAHLFSDDVVRVAVRFDDTKVDDSVAKLDPTARVEPLEPNLTYADGKVSAVDGKDGRGLRGQDVRQALDDAATAGMPLQVKVSTDTLEPRYAKADAERLADQANGPLPTFDVTAGNAKVTVQNETLRSWLSAVATPTALQLAVNPDAANRDLPTLLPNAGTPVVEPHYVVENHTPKWALGKDGTTCCDLTAGMTVAAAVGPRLVAGAVPDSTPIALPLIIAHPKDQTTQAPFADIREQVGAFTTRYPAGQPRVTNIHRIADAVRGQIIQPGAIFSLNGAVGPRTIEKGYVADHAIEDSKFVEAVGGGISQFSTTLFNAAFFSGLEWTEYQSHSIYISRYPYGREATISFPAPDQKIKNTTPYPILIWTSYDRTSVTVEMYSAKYVNAVQSGQSEQKLNHDCTRVKTDRTRNYLDGRTVTDSVYAVYQPKEGVNCWAP